MNYDEIKELLEKYHWILESKSPLNIRSEDGEHHAQNFAAEVLIEYFALLDSSDNEDDKEDLMQRFKRIEPSPLKFTTGTFITEVEIKNNESIS